MIYGSYGIKRFNTRNNFKIYLLSFFILFISTLIIFSFSEISFAAENSTFRLLDANEQGTFNIGLAVGSVTTSFDKDMGQNVLKFDYSAFPKTITGIWTKKYPSSLRASNVDAVKVGIKVPEFEQTNQISVKLEIKGEKSTQSIPFNLKSGWNFFREPISWNKIGELKEVVFVVSTIDEKKVNSPFGGRETVRSTQEKENGEINIISSTSGGKFRGTLYFSVDFYKMSFFQRYSIFLKAFFVFIFSLLIAGITFIFNKLFKKTHVSIQPGKRSVASFESYAARIFSFSRIKRDFMYGVVITLITASMVGIYIMGTKSPLLGGFDLNFLVIGFLGALIAELLKFSITGRHLTPFEAFQNVLLVGILAASSSRLAFFQVPSSWTQLLMLNKIIAAVIFFIYQIFNIRSFIFSDKHLDAAFGISIFLIPYLFNWLMLLQDATIIQTLMGYFSIGMLVSWPVVLKTISRILIAFVFNEVVMNSFSRVIRGKFLKGIKLHMFVFFVSLGVAVSPLIADLGSGTSVASLPFILRVIVAIFTTMFSFAGLWGEVYLITGMALDSGKHTPPSWETVSDHVITGMKKGMVYSGILLGLLYIIHVLIKFNFLHVLAANLPILFSILCGALVFPLLKTIIETFDGSLPFFQRVAYNYRDPVLYARGTIAGLGFSYALTHGLIQKSMSDRIVFGLTVGFFASAGISILRDLVYFFTGQGKIQSWRLYFTDAFLGIFVGSALAFYLDSLQVPQVIEKFKLYISSDFSPKRYITYPLVNKWGRIDLGSYTGGVKLLFTESLAGVINWAIAAWLFAINKVFLQSLFEKHIQPIKFFFSKEGFSQLLEHMIYVLRWGLWMSPIIFTFLRMMPEPTWYNQDGAVRTLFAIYHRITMSPEAFKSWSLNVFICILAYDFFRVLIWMDHMGLRVATLVNLSFLGLDRLDEKVARFIGPAAAQRYIPEAVKRFATWAPLLIPFYLPRGDEWNYAWNTAEAIQKSSGIGMLSILQSITVSGKIVLGCLAILFFTIVSFCVRLIRRRFRNRQIKGYELDNRRYKVVVKDNGDIYSEVLHGRRDVYPNKFDITRRSYDTIDPCGRTLFLVDTEKESNSKKRFWPVVGNFPADSYESSSVERGDKSLKVINENNGVRATIDISLPGEYSTVELWNISIQNLTLDYRNLKIVPYVEWLLNGGLHDRFHTQYARLFVAMEYINRANAILAWQRSTKAMGILSVNLPPEGFLTSRFDFIGRAQSIWKPRALETLNFLAPEDIERTPTFDPIGSLIVNIPLEPKSSKDIQLMIGYSGDEDIGYFGNKRKVFELTEQFLGFKNVSKNDSEKEKKSIFVGHGEILPGTPQPYSEFIDGGDKMLVHTPYTPRPFDHAMTNAAGHSVMVTNRGLHTSCNGNSQQNRLTPDWPDTVTKEIPTEAIYLYDIDRERWYCPTLHPLNNHDCKYESEFGVDGTAIFRSEDKSIETNLTIFVPPDDPLGVYMLTVKNNAAYSRQFRIAPYFQMVLGFQPEQSGKLLSRYDKESQGLLFYNPRNMFRKGWAFTGMSISPVCTATVRGRFFGSNRGIKHPFMVEKGKPDYKNLVDNRQIASFLGKLNIPAHSQRTVAIVLGQTEKKDKAIELVKKYKDLDVVKGKLEETKKWWFSLMETMDVKTNQSRFDRYHNWLKYQTLAERIWARRGFYQTSGAYGFRDQLQDTVNLIWLDPILARKQILVHASHQFSAGDVFHWFFTLTDGRTAFSCRSHASDNPLWLAWGVSEYVRKTGDYSLLDEKTSYVKSEFPFADLPRNKVGWGHLYHRSTKSDTVYEHCMKSINLVLNKRMGKNGLPLIRTGDWNDGLDEIGSEGRGESVWLGVFLYYILKGMIDVIEKKECKKRKKYYKKRLSDLKNSIESMWREDRYLRAIHDDGTEIGIKGSGIWEIDALMASWTVMAGINPERERIMFETALKELERENTVLLGNPPLNEDSEPYLGRSSRYPEGVRENGMYCHGTQWLIKAARILAERCQENGEEKEATRYREITYRLWLKITAVDHTTPEHIEIFGGQPNKQPADILTNFQEGRMIWHGYTGSAGWLLREAYDSVIGANLENNELIIPDDLEKPRDGLEVKNISRNLKKSPFSSKDRV